MKDSTIYLLIGILAFGIIAYGQGWIGTNTFATVGGQTVPQGQAVTVSSYGNCGANNDARLYVVGTSTVLTAQGATTHPVIAAAAGTSGAALYRNGVSSLTSAAQSSALAATYTAFGTAVKCGESYYVIAGNDTAAATKTLNGVTDFYLTATDPVTIDAGDKYFDVSLQPIGNLTITAAGPAGTWSASPLVMGAMAASTTYNNYEIRLSESARGYYNQPHVAFGVSAGATLTKIGQFTIFRPTGTNVVQDNVPNRMSGTYTEAYKLADTIPYAGQLQFPLEITTAATYAPNSANITMIAYDYGTYENKGKVVTAAENLANVNIGGEDSAVYVFDCN